MKHLKPINESSTEKYTTEDIKDIQELLIDLKEDGFELRVFIPNVQNVQNVQNAWPARQVAPVKKLDKYIQISITKRDQICMNLNNITDFDEIYSKLESDAQSVNLHYEQIKEILPRLVSMGYAIKKFYVNRIREWTDTVIEIQ